MKFISVIQLQFATHILSSPAHKFDILHLTRVSLTCWCQAQGPIYTGSSNFGSGSLAYEPDLQCRLDSNLHTNGTWTFAVLLLISHIHLCSLQSVTSSC